MRTLAEKRREAHVIIRAFDSVMWSSAEDFKAERRVINSLWTQSLLTGIILPPSIAEQLYPKHRVHYDRFLKEWMQEQGYEFHPDMVYALAHQRMQEALQ